MTRPALAAPWPLRCNRALPLASAPGSGCGVWGGLWLLREDPTLTGSRCASVQGFSLHANTPIPAHRRDQLERLIRSTARGPCHWSGWHTMPTAPCSTPHPPVVGWHNRSTRSPWELLEQLAAGGATAACASWGRYGGCWALARCAESMRRRHASKAWRSRSHRPFAALELGTVAQAGVCH